MALGTKKKIKIRKNIKRIKRTYIQTKGKKKKTVRNNKVKRLTRKYNIKTGGTTDIITARKRPFVKNYVKCINSLNRNNIQTTDMCKKIIACYTNRECDNMTEPIEENNNYRLKKNQHNVNNDEPLYEVPVAYNQQSQNEENSFYTDIGGNDDELQYAEIGEVKQHYNSQIIPENEYAMVFSSENKRDDYLNNKSNILPV